MKMKWLSLLVVATTAFSLFAKSSSSKTFTYGDITLEPEESLSFSVDEMPAEIGGMEVLEEYLPSGIDVEWTGKKFKTPKATKVKYSKETESFDVKNDERENYCGLKISIKKNGSVSGSFKVYVAKSEKKVKALTAKVSGRLGNTLKVTVKGVSGSYEATLE